MTFNIWNQDSIDKFLGMFAKDDPHLLRLLIVALKKPLLNHAPTASRAYVLPEDAPDWMRSKFNSVSFYSFGYSIDDLNKLAPKMGHVIDWIRGAIARGEEWTKEEKPGRLTHFKTIDDAYKAADRAVDFLRAQTGKLKLDPAIGTEIVMEFPDGWKIRRLVTAEAKDYDGYYLRHCVGDGAYDNEVIYSLRKPDKKVTERPVATLCVDSFNSLQECGGYTNQPPVENAFPYIFSFMKKNKILPMQQSSLRTHIFIARDSDDYYSIYDLPANIDLKNDIDLKKFQGTLTLPKNLRVGALELRATSIGSSGDWDDIKSLVSIPDDLVARSIGFAKYFRGKKYNPEGPACVLFDGATKQKIMEIWTSKNEHKQLTLRYDYTPTEVVVSEEWSHVSESDGGIVISVNKVFIKDPQTDRDLKEVWDKWQVEKARRQGNKNMPQMIFTPN